MDRLQCAVGAWWYGDSIGDFTQEPCQPSRHGTRSKAGPFSPSCARSFHSADQPAIEPTVVILLDNTNKHLVWRWAMPAGVGELAVNNLIAADARVEAQPRIDLGEFADSGGTASAVRSKVNVL